MDHDGGDEGSVNAGVLNWGGYYVEYEDTGLAGCVGLDRMFPIYGLDGGGWTLVRRVAPGPAWHPATDQLSGSEPAYGTFSTDPTVGQTFGVPFDNLQFDEFLFATGDGQEWLIADRAQVQEAFGGPSPRQIQMSSTSSTPYTAEWYHRTSQPEDPWISLTNHGEAIGQGNMLYGENNFGGAHAANVLPAHNGANVSPAKVGLSSRHAVV